MCNFVSSNDANIRTILLLRLRVISHVLVCGRLTKFAEKVCRRKFKYPSKRILESFSEASKILQRP